MNEWVLIITMSLLTSPGTVRDIENDFIDGFRTKAACEAAGNTLSYRLVHLAGEHRDKQKINRSTSASSPSIYTDCVQIKK